MPPLVDTLRLRLAEIDAEKAIILDTLSRLETIAAGTMVEVPTVAHAMSGKVVPGRQRSRRTKAEMHQLRENTLGMVGPVARHSSDVFAMLVEAGMAEDERKDRDQVIRILREEAAAGRLLRNGNQFVTPPPVTARQNTYEYDEEPF